MPRAMPLMVSTLAVALCSLAAGQDKSNMTRRNDEYFVAAAKTYNMHAHDHARMLGKFAAASANPVPKEVVQEHATAIKANVERARTSYAKLADSAKKNPGIAGQLAEIQDHLAKVTAQLAALEKASAGEAVESKLLVSQSAAISQELKATHSASKKIDAALIQSAEAAESFDDPQSSNYYFTGEGHFID